MTPQDETYLVFGATGQQGGSVAAALIDRGQHVRAVLRDLSSARAAALRELGAETVPGSFDDLTSLRAAMAGVRGVFSVQPSSGQFGSEVSDADEVRFGTTVADVAVEQGVPHLVYSSAAAAGAATGIGHFESKAQVERHLAGLELTSTIVRPATFMDIVLEPDFGAAGGELTFFMRPDQAMQFVAVADIGAVVAAVFADPSAFSGRVLELAGDSVTGDQLATSLTAALGRAVSYRRFPDEVLDQNPLLRKLVDAVDDGPLAGSADIAMLRELHPGLLTFDAWLTGVVRPGRHDSAGGRR